MSISLSTGFIGLSSAKLILGPDLIPASPSVTIGANWTQVDARNYTRASGGFGWLAFNGVITGSKTYELKYRISSWSGGSLTPYLTTATQGNVVSFGGETADDTYTVRATSNSDGEDLAFGAGAGNGSLEVIYLKEVL